MPPCSDGAVEIPEVPLRQIVVDGPGLAASLRHDDGQQLMSAMA